MSAEIQKLEKALTTAIASSRSLNPLADLLKLLQQTKKPAQVSQAIYALYRIFVLLVPKLLETTSNGDAKTVRTWLYARLNAYVEYLAGLLKDDEQSLRISALQILFSLLKHLSSAASSSSSPQIHNSHLRKTVHALLSCPPSPRKSTSSDGLIDPDVLQKFHTEYFSKFDDIRWFFLREAATFIQKPDSPPHATQNLLSILELLTTFPEDPKDLKSWWVPEFALKPIAGPVVEEEEEDDWRKFFDDDLPDEPAAVKTGRASALPTHTALHALASHRAVFTRAWLVLLPRQPDEHRVLRILHRQVLPHLTRPVLVMDWVGGVVERGGPEALLALNTLFILMTKYNLDYPSFYTHLQTLLTRDVLHSKHRARFLRMLEVFLSSSHIPLHTLAPFLNRLITLSLSAPPAGILPVLVLVYNCIQKEVGLVGMIHSTDDEITEGKLPQLHPLPSHSSHYLPSVGTITKVFSQPLTRKDGLSLEAFLDFGYAALFDSDIKRPIKREPALGILPEIHGKKRKYEVFHVRDEAAKRKRTDIEETDEVIEEDDVVNQLWNFGT
ncbi:CBF/Mak21 family-domain-containing protein [Mycena floridula]|nr:CBF/Mak21 family-domain-containing protein [Mycena floridula]